MNGAYLSYKNSSIGYQVYGTGKRVVLCFHGYGESASSFNYLAAAGGQAFTFIAITLPFHDQTEWKEGLLFTTEDLVLITNRLLQKEGFDSPASLGLLGYSLGGRMALALYSSDPGKFSRVGLVAPDGLKINPWYWLVTQTWAGNKFFQFTMKQPYWLFGFLRFLNRLGWINASIYKFIHLYIDDKKVRDNLYQRWTALRKIKPDLKKIKKMIRAHKTAFRLIYGRYDKIILPVRGELFCKDTGEYCSIRILETGHQLLQEKYAGEIIDALLR